MEKVLAVVNSGASCLVIGEAGQFDGLAAAIAGAFSGVSAIQTYKGSGKRFFVQLAESLGVPATETKYDRKGEPSGERSLTVDELKEELAGNVQPGTLLIFPEARRLTTSIRYWLEDLMADGVLLLAMAVDVPRKDIFLEMLEVELSLPSDREVREVMRSEAQRLGVEISEARLAALQGQVGRNPLLAKKAIANERLGLNVDPQHSQYLDISPIINSMLLALGILRFIGMGTGNRALYIVGGVSLILGLCLRQLGRVRGARKRLGG